MGNSSGVQKETTSNVGGQKEKCSSAPAGPSEEQGTLAENRPAGHISKFRCWVRVGNKGVWHLLVRSRAMMMAPRAVDIGYLMYACRQQSRAGVF